MLRREVRTPEAGRPGHASCSHSPRPRPAARPSPDKEIQPCVATESQHKAFAGQGRETARAPYPLVQCWKNLTPKTSNVQHIRSESRIQMC